MECRTEGTVISAKKQWWCSVRTKAFRTGPLDGTIFPYIIKVKYTVDGKEYTKRKWISAGRTVPEVGSTVQLSYDSEKPQKMKLI